MGLRKNLATAAWLERSGDATIADPRSSRGRVAMRSPFQTGSLSPLLWNDLFGLALPMMNRQQAMTIPGVSRARGIILSLIADVPLVDYKGDVPTDPQPAWLTDIPDPQQGPWERMVDTIDDHIFYGWSLWGTERGVNPTGLNPILAAWHIPFDAWEVDELGRICVLDEDGHFMPADDQEVILIRAASEGLLTVATRTLTGSVELEKAWVQRAKNPIPMLELHETIESGIEQDEAQEVVDAWARARADENGGIAYTPNTIEARALGQYSPDMFIQARNSARLDVAAFFQIPGSLLDATTATASLTYVTQEGQASSLDTLTIPYWARPIEDRLSRGDVTVRGRRVRFDWTRGLTAGPGPIVTNIASIDAPIPTDAASVVALPEEVIP
jgi:hypothetical protein